MNTIKDKISNLISGWKYRKAYYGIESNFKVIDVFDDIASERIDWSIIHGNFDKTGFTGKGERIAILDTGVDLDHKDLIGQVDGFCFIDGCKDDPPYKDTSSHGTFCISQVVAKRNGFGIIGVAPEASCFSGRVLYGDGRDKAIYRFEYFLSNAIYAAIEDGCGVISMSLGSPHKSPIIEKAVNYASEKGVLLFAAAGNDGMNGSLYKSYPAAFENVISVGSSSAIDLPHWYSTAGIGNNKLEQPEVSISSLEYYWGCLPGNKYGKMTGTSQACPTMAGVALLWRQAMRQANKLPYGINVLKEFRIWLQKNTIDTNKNGWDNILGYGVLKLVNGKI